MYRYSDLYLNIFDVLNKNSFLSKELKEILVHSFNPLLQLQWGGGVLRFQNTE